MQIITENFARFSRGLFATDQFRILSLTETTNFSSPESFFFFGIKKYESNAWVKTSFCRARNAKLNIFTSII